MSQSNPSVSATATPPATNVMARVNKDGTASIQVTAPTPAEALALLDEMVAGLEARGLRTAGE